MKNYLIINNLLIQLEKISSCLNDITTQTDAGLAHIIALCAYNQDKKIKLLQDDAYIMITME